MRQFILCFNLYRDVRTKVDKRIFIYCFRLEIIRVKMLLFSVRQKLLFKLNSHVLKAYKLRVNFVYFYGCLAVFILFYFIILHMNSNAITIYIKVERYKKRKIVYYAFFMVHFFPPPPPSLLFFFFHL